MSNIDQDANATAGTSSYSAPTNQDANANAAGTSTGASPNVAKETLTLQDVIGKAVGDVGKSTDPSTATPNPATTQQPGAVPGQENVQKTDAEKELEAKQKEVEPFHNHPRWKEVTQERDNFKAQVDTVTAERDSYKQVVGELQGYLSDTGMQHEELNQTLDMAGMFKKGDMAGFLKAVVPLVQHAQMRTGEFLPADVQARIDAGTLDVDTAKQIVMTNAQKADAEARLLAYQQQQQAATQKTQQEAQAAEQTRLVQQHEQAFRSAHETWMASNRATDPGFATLERAVIAEALLIRNANPNGITNPQAWTGVLEQAKKAVIDREIARNGGKRPVTHFVPSSNNGSTSTNSPASAANLKDLLVQVVGPAVG